MLEKARNSENLFDLLNSLTVLARFRQEIGEFIKVDNYLDEVKAILKDNTDKLKAQNEEQYIYYNGKYYHLQAKNFAREYYHQKALEIFYEGIDQLQEQFKGFDKIRYKFICKLNEGLGHLFCEPLIFDKCENYFNVTQHFYLDAEKGLSRKQYLQFLIKKASFLKKYGFFDESIQILKDIEYEVNENIKNPNEKFLENKKILFKVFRDSARLYALKRQEELAYEAHNKAEKLLKEEIFDSNTQANIKLAKLQLLKGLWSAKFDFKKSNDELIEAYHLFAEVIGMEENYFGANSQLEIGSNYLRLKESATCAAFLYRANETFEKLFGEGHPLIQKYYSYTAEVYSNADDNINMLQMADKYLKIVERSNISRDGKPSLFVLDALLQMISMQCQTQQESESKDLIKNVEKMETILVENGIIDGCQLLHSAYTMRSILYIREEKINDALELLERTYNNQIKKLRNEKAHPFLEQSINQLGLLYKATRNFEKAEEMYGLMIRIKETYYGEFSESLIPVLKNIAGVQSMQNKNDLAVETLCRAINIAKKLLVEGKVKDKQSLKTHTTESIMILLQIYNATNQHKLGQQELNSQSQLMKDLHGENSPQYAYYLFLKAKVLTMSDEPEQQALSLEAINQAIKIEETIQSTNPIKTPQLGRYYYCAGTIYQGMNKSQETLEQYQKAKEILGNYQEYADLVAELDKQIDTLTDKINEDEHGSQAGGKDLSNIIILGSVVALAAGATAFAIMKLRK